VKAYASYSDCENKNADGSVNHYLSSFSYSIPYVISTLDDTYNTTQYTYYNPTKNKGFVPNDYLNVDLDKVKTRIEKSSS
jgi:hypothetical protein